MFESIPLSIINLLILTKRLKLAALLELSETGTIWALVSALANIVKTIILLYIQSSYLKENIIDYSLICMKARFGYIPFMKAL